MVGESEKPAAAPAGFQVLQLDEASGMWHLLGNFAVESRKAAIRAACSQQGVDRGTFQATPAKEWQPRSVRPKHVEPDLVIE